MRTFSTAIAATTILVGLSTGAGAQSAEQAMAAAVAASEKYQDVNVALAAGFVKDPSGACVSAGAEGLPPEWGAMGVHYLNMAKLQITGGEPLGGEGIHTDFNDPAILMYEPQADGSMVLVAIENLVFQAAWSAAGNAEPPSFAGVVWDAMADDPATEASESHGFAPHFDRHFWAFRDNP
ncbi:MAG: hypothetical protein ACC619_10430, partial [Paracoccaceae bacterium]